MMVQTAGHTSRIAEERTLGQFVRRVSLPPLYGALLHHFVQTYKPSQIIELGTGSGISTLYMAMAAQHCEAITIDAHPQATQLARELCLAARADNISLVTSSFTNYLETIKEKSFGRLLVFLDGDHSFEATLCHFDLLLQLHYQSILIIIDDVDWSPGMMGAWRQLRIDYPHFRFRVFFRFGIVECFKKK